MGVNILAAIGIAVLAVLVLVGLLKLVFNLIVLGVGIAIAVGAWFAIERLVGKGR